MVTKEFEDEHPASSPTCDHHEDVVVVVAVSSPVVSSSVAGANLLADEGAVRALADPRAVPQQRADGGVPVVVGVGALGGGVAEGEALLGGGHANVVLQVVAAAALGTDHRCSSSRGSDYKYPPL